MTHKAPQYKSFILRMWQESSAGEGWRVKISNLNGESEPTSPILTASLLSLSVTQKMKT